MSGYIGNIPVPQATQSRQSFTATASQTSFATVGYTAGFLDVYLNGVHLLDGTDYTATNGSDIVLTTGAALNDVVEFVAYETFSVLDQSFTGTTTVDVLSVTGAATGTDLTLSGGVYLGGTGAANKLDDYEEGTWTPTILQGASGISYSTQFGKYIKTGNMVNCWFMIIGSWTAVASDVRIGGVPFQRAATSTWTSAGYITGTGFNPAESIAMPLFPSSGSYVIPINVDGSGPMRLISGSKYVEGSFSYSTF